MRTVISKTAGTSGDVITSSNVIKYINKFDYDFVCEQTKGRRDQCQKKPHIGWECTPLRLRCQNLAKAFFMAFFES